MDETELLIKDLCARAPYNNTIVSVADFTEGKVIWDKEKLTLSLLHRIEKEEGAWEFIKPYLRPISSMTREELKELRDIFNNIIDFDEWGLDILNSDFKKFSYLELLAIFDWFNKHYFDVRDLIGKNLAIEVTDKNNPYERID